MVGVLTKIAMPVCNILAAALVGIMVVSNPARSADPGTWPVYGKLLGKNGNRSEDMSGIACARPQGFPRECLVIDDNVQAAQFVTLKDWEIIVGETIRLIDNSFNGKDLELDGEGVAYAGGFYYVIGSHGYPRDSEHRLDAEGDADKITARIAASSQIVRFRSDGSSAASSVERTAKLHPIIAQVSALSPYLDRRLDENGVTIEGIAVRSGRILAGFRGPSLDNGRAAVLSVAIDSVFGNEAAADKHLFELPLGEGRASAISQYSMMVSLCLRARLPAVPAPMPSIGGTARAKM